MNELLPLIVLLVAIGSLAPIFIYVRRKDRRDNPPDSLGKPGATPLYSPDQASIGAFIGGPVGFFYFIRKNFISLHRPTEARPIVAIATVLLLIIVLFGTHFPKGLGFCLALSYSLAAKRYVERTQMTKEAIKASQDFTFKSDGRALLASLLCLVASVAIFVTLKAILRSLGMVV